MKEIGSAAKAGSQMVKGQQAFDAEVAQRAMSTVAEHWTAFVRLFPDTSKAGGETTASPRIWEDLKDFAERGIAMAEAAEAATAAAAEGEKAFKERFSEVATSCRSCHRLYRLPRR